jgi:FkbM family methyltransferase
MILSLLPRLRLLAKHALGRDLYLRPDARCATTYYGSRYGGWALPRDHVQAESVVYSFGIGEDASFDLALIATTGCAVHAFDPTPRSLRWVEREVTEPRFIVHPWALGADDGTMQLWLPVDSEHVSASCRPSSDRSDVSFVARSRQLPTIMAELGHERVDVVKLDIEGAEYDVIRSLLDARVLDRVGCLLVEFHHWMEGFERRETIEAIRGLRAAGFLILWVSETGHELLFGRAGLAGAAP